RHPWKAAVAVRAEPECRSGRAGAVELERAGSERVANELGAAREAKLLHDPSAVRLGRAHRDEEKLRDLLVRVAEREQVEDLVLAFRERIGLGAMMGLRLE